MPESKPASAPARALARGRLRSAVGWLVLLVYLVAFSPMGFGMAALLGSLDPNHELRASLSESGLQLVLHHGAKCLTHHHGAMARALTIFAQPTSVTEPDHVLQFGTTESYTQPARLAAPSLTAFEQPVSTLVASPFCAPHEPQPSSVSPHPPPNEGGRLVCLRSTQLLV